MRRVYIFVEFTWAVAIIGIAGSAETGQIPYLRLPLYIILIWFIGYLILNIMRQARIKKRSAHRLAPADACRKNLIYIKNSRKRSVCQ